MRQGRCGLGVSAVILTVAASVSCGSRPAGGHSADDARTFFAGKTMTYVVATEAGGGYDAYGRLIARFIGKYLGLSRVVVKNVPGGAHLRGAHEIHAARPDGLTIGTFNTGLLYSQLLRSDDLGFNLTDLTWVGKAGSDARVLVMSKASGFRSLDDIRRARRPLMLGSSGVGTQGHNDGALLAHALGLETKVVFGLSANDAQMSMMRGEIDGQVAAFSSYRSFLRNGYGHAVLRIGGGGGDDAAIPGVETEPLTDQARELIDLVRTQAALLRWTAGPPGIPRDRVTVLREAYINALNDPALLAEAAALQLPIAPMDGAALAAEVARVLTLPRPTVELLATVLAAGRGTP